VIRHLFKLVWTRKRSNALLIIEILFSFLIVFSVVTLASSMSTRWKEPLGYDYHDVWMLRFSFPVAADIGGGDDSTLRATVASAVRELRALPQVEAVAASGSPAYGNSTWQTSLSVDNRHVDVTRDAVTDDYLKVMRLHLLRGRWFAPQDEASERLIVCDADAARALFGTVDAVGKLFDGGDSADVPADVSLSHPATAAMYRVIGVVEPFRKDGEFSSPGVNMVFDRMSLTRKQGRLGRSLVVRVRPGSTAELEQTMIRSLHAVAPDVDVRIQRMEQQRALRNKGFIAPALLAGIVAAFLIVMVTLGLSGVLWQNVTRRRREIGLRRAVGATAMQVNQQILLEVALLSTMAVAVGVIVLVQLPIAGIFHYVSLGNYLTGIAGALVTIYGLTLLCGLYPSWLAGRIEPAEALHYD
jgi:putative ABC transport system permease protein